MLMKREKRYTALIVDDDLESLISMSQYLNIVFKTVYKAQNAQEALDVLQHSRPDIVFTDIQMPDIDGFSLIEQIRENDLKTPIVIISAYDDKEYLLKAIKLDIIDYIIKPLTSTKLKNTMHLAIKKLYSLDPEVVLGKNLILNKSRFNLFRDGKVVHLTLNEAKLLKVLSNNTNRTLDSTFLFDSLWSESNKEYSAKSIRILISKLRKKLLPSDLIKNIYGGKYMLVLDDNA